MDIKKWLESTGYKAADTAFKKPPALPYLVFLDSVVRGGGDMRNMMKTHSLTVEYYSETSEDCTTLETLIDSVPVEYKREKQWLDSEKCFMTIYNFELIEREVI